MATPVITPKQLLNSNNYCEIILLGKTSKPKSVIYLSDTYQELAYKLSNELNLPLKKISPKPKTKL